MIYTMYCNFLGSYLLTNHCSFYLFYSNSDHEIILHIGMQRKTHKCMLLIAAGNILNRFVVQKVMKVVDHMVERFHSLKSYCFSVETTSCGRGINSKQHHLQGSPPRDLTRGPSYRLNLQLTRGHTEVRSEQSQQDACRTSLKWIINT